jgi:glutamate formiminotransferase / 5-formyltetrahydrofolate cyclo-ligase
MPLRSRPDPLLAVPNVSEGRDRIAIDMIAASWSASEEIRLLDAHADQDHHRAVLTLAGSPRSLSDALVQGARATISRIDVMSERPGGSGQHPHVGAIDVLPVVYLDDTMRGAACAEALVIGDRIGEELGIPVFLYGELTAAEGTPPRTRAELRRGGRRGLAERIASGEQLPDFGPPVLHPTAGATLVAAREPLVALNLELAPPATVADARGIAALIREDGTEGLRGLRAIGVALQAGKVAQVSMNVERPLELPLARVVQTVARHANVTRAEIVGLAPRAALAGFPEDIPLPDFDPERQLIETALCL